MPRREGNVPEIEIATALGDVTDRVLVYGTSGNDVMAAGQNGFAANTDGDVDVTFSPGAFRSRYTCSTGTTTSSGVARAAPGCTSWGRSWSRAAEENESLLRGSSEIDSIDGGPGNDVLQGQELADTLTGGDGNDALSGGDGNDLMTGGAGADVFNGSGGDDTMAAQDIEVDTTINGRPGLRHRVPRPQRPGSARHRRSPSGRPSRAPATG